MPTDNKEVDIIVKHMCEIINIDYDTINTKEEDWYQKHSWTIEQENNFIDWLANYLYTNKQARLELYNVSHKFTKTQCKKKAGFFVFNYGWKLLDKQICK
jgi:transcriptional regulator of NAD metabolism